MWELDPNLLITRVRFLERISESGSRKKNHRSKDSILAIARSKDGYK